MELHPATLWEALADTIPDRPAVIQGSTRRTWRDFETRSARLAGVLRSRGVGVGSKVGLLLYNSPEFLETYFAALKLRAVPFNINYRYTATELAYLLENADADVLVYHSSLSGPVADARATPFGSLQLIEVDAGGTALPDALSYEVAIAGAEPAARMTRHPDDVTMTYTGGTTGMPKGVVNRVGPGIEGLLRVIPPMGGYPPMTIDEVPPFAAGLGDAALLVSVPASPLMHATGMGIGVQPALATGGTVVLLGGRSFDAGELWDVAATEGVTAITVVGDAFARPMLAELRRDPSHDLSRVRFISSSGAMFSKEVKSGLLEHLPQAVIIDLIAATEGTMGMSITTAASPAQTGRFHPDPGVIVVADDGTVVEPGSGVGGRIAVPGGAEGYYKDEAKTAATFQMIDGRRYTIPGDYATVNADGSLSLLGRGSQCINTAGEKVYPEEVEEVLKTHPAVVDALVFGVDDERFGQKVVAVISRHDGVDDPVEAILDAARVQLAAYKLPRVAVVVDEVPRTQVGKPDYRTARALFDAQA